MADFLSLSPELRNRIYEYLFDGHSKLVLTRRPPRYQGNPSSAFYLTQASRQIRMEFGPLFKRRQRITVALEELPQFLWLFYYREHETTTNQYARLKINAPEIHRSWHECYISPPPVIDLGLLLRLLCDSPDKFFCSFWEQKTTILKVLPDQLMKIQICLLSRKYRDLLRSEFGLSPQKTMVGLKATLHIRKNKQEFDRLSLTWYPGSQAVSTDTPSVLKMVEGGYGDERIEVNEFSKS